MVNGPMTPIPVKAKPSSVDPVVPSVSLGMAHINKQLGKYFETEVLN